MSVASRRLISRSTLEATAFIAVVALPRRQHRQFVMQGIKQRHYAKHQDEQRGPCRRPFQQFQQFPYDRAFRVHRCEAPFSASAMRPSKLLSTFRTSRAFFAYSASVNRPAASRALRSL